MSDDLAARTDSYFLKTKAIVGKFRDKEASCGRYCEGLDRAGSYDVLERNAPQAIRGYRTEWELRYLVGTGVTAAALWRLREVLNAARFPNAKIVASSGFGPEKCRMMRLPARRST